MLKFADNLRDIVGTNITAAAKAIGIPQATLQRYVSGQRYPSIDILEKIADYYKCSIDYLIGREAEDGQIIIAPSQEKQNNDEKEMIDLYRQLGRDFQNQTKGFMIRLIEEQQRIDWLKKKA